MMRHTLYRLHEVAKPDRLNALSPADLLAVVRLVFGEQATLDTYADFIHRWRRLEPIGRELAEWVVTYGLPPRALTPDEVDALDIAQPYAAALRVRHAAEAQAVAAGAAGSLDYYSTFTNGDAKAAKRLWSEAQARAALR